METVSKSGKVSVASAAMVALVYPGEIQDSASRRWMRWFFAMIPFVYVMAELAVGLDAASQKLAPSVASPTACFCLRYGRVGRVTGRGFPKLAPSVASPTSSARWLTIISWLTYPFLYIIKMLGISGVSAPISGGSFGEKSKREEEELLA